jgi:hypothetical protein
MSNPFGRIGLLGATIHPVKRQSGSMFIQSLATRQQSLHPSL